MKKGSKSKNGVITKVIVKRSFYNVCCFYQCFIVNEAYVYKRTPQNKEELLLISSGE